MKTVFFGGGSHRLVSIIRGALAQPGIFDNGGEIFLYDPNVQRAEAVGRIVLQCPEYKKSQTKIAWGASLDEALPGASAVTVTLSAPKPKNGSWSDELCRQHGFMGSDNVSPDGSMFGVIGAPILLNLARKMEQHCPDAWILDFANPVAVLAGMINRHTKIKALGVCGGFTNHLSDIGRIFGKDEARNDVDVDAAGINHLSFIVRGTIGGRDIFEEIDKILAKDWKMPQLHPKWGSGDGIKQSVTNLVRFYRELGVLIFSTEGDGMYHLAYEEFMKRDMAGWKPQTRAEVDAHVDAGMKKRMEENAAFEAHAKQDLDATFWAAQKDGSIFERSPDDIFLRTLRAIAGVERMKIVSSYLNNGAIEGFPDGNVVEYSQFLYKNTICSAGRYKVPGVVYGLVSALSNHQTMLGDACATEDPKLLAEALLAYPARSYSKDARSLYREMIEVNKEQIATPLHRAVDYLK
jgi:6-phospho-beta-glucosidase